MKKYATFNLNINTKHIFLISLGIIFINEVHAQSLQSVSDNGNTTNNTLYIRTFNKENAEYHSLVVGQRPNNDGIASLWLTGSNGNQNGQFAAVTHHSSDNSFRIYNNGEYRMTVSASGDMGIGTDNPIARMHIFNSPQNSNGNTLILGPVEGSNLRLGYNTEYSWIQSHGEKPLFINELGNNVVINALGGNVGIGTLTPRERLAVNGNIRAKEIKVEQLNWPDFVFDNDYSLLSLSEIERFINEKKHLPAVPSAEDIRHDGLSLGKMNAVLLQKVEELTLHLIKKDKEVKELRQRIERIEKKIN